MMRTPDIHELIIETQWLEDRCYQHDEPQSLLDYLSVAIDNLKSAHLIFHSEDCEYPLP